MATLAAVGFVITKTPLPVVVVGQWVMYNGGVLPKWWWRSCTASGKRGLDLKKPKLL